MTDTENLALGRPKYTVTIEFQLDQDEAAGITNEATALERITRDLNHGSCDFCFPKDAELKISVKEIKSPEESP